MEDVKRESLTKQEEIRREELRTGESARDMRRCAATVLRRPTFRRVEQPARHCSDQKPVVWRKKRDSPSVLSRIVLVDLPPD